MKSYRTHLAVLGVLFGLAGGTAQAQVKSVTNAAPVDRATAGRILPPAAPPSGEPSAVQPSDAIDRPDRPERLVPPEVQFYLRQFRTAREAYLHEQEQLEKLLKGATDADRSQIRDRIQASRAQWLRQARSLQEETTQRMREIRRALPKHRDATDETRKELRGRKTPGLD